jgi:hypothetical protein
MAPELRTFCRVLSYTGARISEVLALTPSHIDASARLVVLECLKKRRRGIFRAVPLPESLFDELDRVHHLSDHAGHPDSQCRRLWPWCRTIAWRRIKEAMAAGHVVGPQATPKGLRHGFAVTALQGGVPITMVRRWLGHSRLSTTEIYADAIRTRRAGDRKYFVEYLLIGLLFPHPEPGPKHDFSEWAIVMLQQNLSSAARILMPDQDEFGTLAAAPRGQSVGCPLDNSQLEHLGNNSGFPGPCESVGRLISFQPLRGHWADITTF